MAFPLSLTGRLRIVGEASVGVPRTCARIHDALVAETVEQVVHTGSTIRFRARIFDHRTERPGGGRWRFSLYDSGLFEVAEADGLVIRYRLGTGRKFALFGGAAAACLLLAVWLWSPISFMLILIGGIAFAAFTEQYVKRARRLREWLALVAIFDAPPPAEPAAYAELD